ncbi:hypothetical protein [Bacillus cereus]|uniref:hypothetical protein n=1 Tax=Bacillus cereus TaxID=1396 RepID=UPI0020D285BA|nr:hypothetical protein [Bacillus cereus]
MSKAVVINFPAESYINPTIEVVKELVNKAEDVVYYCEEEYRFKLKNADVQFRNYGGMLEEINLKNRMKDIIYAVKYLSGVLVIRIVTVLLDKIIKLKTFHSRKRISLGVVLYPKAPHGTSCDTEKLILLLGGEKAAKKKISIISIENGIYYQ